MPTWLASPRVGVEKLVQQLGVERMSKSQVSRLAQSLDEIVEDFCTRPLRVLTLDALVVKVVRGFLCI
jgi:transposase-like protein